MLCEESAVGTRFIEPNLEFELGDSLLLPVPIPLLDDDDDDDDETPFRLLATGEVAAAPEPKLEVFALELDLPATLEPLLAPLELPAGDETTPSGVYNASEIQAASPLSASA